MSVLAVEARRLRYVIGGRTILNNVSLEVKAGTSLAVVGPSGTGKTTLLMCLAGLLPPTGGQVLLAGQDLMGLSQSARAALRLRQVGVVYQFGELLPELSPLENVALPALLGGARRREAYARAESLLQDLDVGMLAGSPTSALSGGERQRIAVARALVSEPAVVLADEPTGSLDRAATEAVSDLLFALPGGYGVALLVVTHNDHVAGRADQVLSLDSGRVCSPVAL